jgi:thiol-disulfide isomerase/thioredoxin
MEKTLKTMILAVLFIGLLVGAALLYTLLGETVDIDKLSVQTVPTQPATSGTHSASNNTAPDNTAPDFTVTDREGNQFRLSDFRGKPVVLNFWASWCGPCKSEMPDFQAAYEKYGDEIHFLMINLTDGAQETVQSAWQFIKKQGYTFPVYYDTVSSGAIAYGVSSIPVTFFIDADGNLVVYGRGALDAATLQKGIDMIYPQS